MAQNHAMKCIQHTHDLIMFMCL